jgi:DNA-binding GntR family transcriptional regulator
VSGYTDEAWADVKAVLHALQVRPGIFLGTPQVAAYAGVSEDEAREALLELRDLGLVRRDELGAWRALTDQEIEDVEADT